jgi:hypothetical protein
MSGRHRKPQPDALADVDVAREVTPGPVVEAGQSRPVPGPERTAASGTTVVARRSRAAQRAARRARTRRRVLVLAGGVVGVLALVAAVTVLLLRGGGEDDTRTATEPAPQRTLLLQLTGVDGTAAASALMGVTAKERTAAVVLVPSGLLVDVAGSGDIPFGETATLPEPAAGAQALTDLLGVRVDDSWALTSEGMAALVDAVGGVPAAVDVDVVTTDGDGNQTVVVRAGTQTLSGAAAVEYAKYLAEGEPEQARLARFDDVLSGVLDALPEEPARVQAVIGEVGEESAATLDDATLAARLARLKAASGAGSLVSDILPVTEIDAGAETPTYGLDLGQVAAMMRSLFPGALLTAEGGDVVRVLVENGVGTPGLVEQARADLVAEGFRFIIGGNASPFTDEPSAVLVPDGTERSMRRGERVAAALGLPASSVEPTSRGQSVADVIVILGADFAP